MEKWKLVVALLSADLVVQHAEIIYTLTGGRQLAHVKDCAFMPQGDKLCCCQAAKG